MLDRIEEERKTKIYSNATYQKASAVTEREFQTAAALYRSISGFRNADALAEECEALAAAARRKTEEERLERERQKELARMKQEKRIKLYQKIALIAIAGVAVIIFAFILVNQVIIPARNYGKAEALLAAGDEKGALQYYAKAGDYKDAPDRILAVYYEKTKTPLAAGDAHILGLKDDGTVIAAGDNRYGQTDVSSWRDITAISAGGEHTIGLKSDGTVVAAGNDTFGRTDVSGWRDMVAVSAGSYHTAGLKADGTVAATGWNQYGQTDVSSWRDIIAVSAGNRSMIALKSDGTLVTAGISYDVSNWQLLN